MTPPAASASSTVCPNDRYDNDDDATASSSNSAEASEALAAAEVSFPESDDDEEDATDCEEMVQWRQVTDASPLEDRSRAAEREGGKYTAIM